MKILLATTNPGKIKELKHLIADYAHKKGIEICSLKEMDQKIEVHEDQPSFYGNAFKKAKEYYEFYQIPVIADDSGLVVPSLDGSPGVFSSRYSGENATDEENMQLLLKNIKKVLDKKAYFESSVVYYGGEHQVYHAYGKIEGEIIDLPRGNNGFGYDPVFYVTQKGKTMAELTLEEKNQISHRKQAFEKVLKQLSENRII